MFQGPKARNAVASLVVARVVYAINWLNVGAIFYLMAPDLGSGVGGLGLLSATFYLGVGLSQVPGGLLAARWGHKKIVVAGILTFSVSSLASSVGGSLLELGVLRFFVGVGMAFVFAPAVVLISRLLKGRRSGVGVGLFNSAFNIGGLFGLFGWIVFASAFGWRPSLALSGFLGIITALLVAVFVPADNEEERAVPSKEVVLQILSDWRLLLLGLGTLGMGVGNIMISTFMVYYLVHEAGVAGSAAGLVASLIVLVPIASALWAGRLYDRTRRPRRLMLYSLLGMGGSILLLAFDPGLFPAALAAAGGGVSSGLGFTVSFAAARDLNRAPPAYDGMAVAWVNCVSLTSSFWPPVLFSFLVGASGYPAAWLGSALICLAMAIPVAAMGEGVPSRAE
ncbi:MAG: MFS transporter [Thaumarchaeota archaeon]|nr:MFS transporter [Nitrososphaerota archaeon]